MSMTSTPVSDRIHIGFFGCRNVGKSSVVNAVTGQDLAVVSDVKGTTTDPVMKTMELLPLGPVVIIDTPGLDDEGELGELRIKKTMQILNKTDIAILVEDATASDNSFNSKLIGLFKEKGLPFLEVMNKSDLLKQIPDNSVAKVYVSAVLGYGIQELKERIGRLIPDTISAKSLIGDIISQNDPVILVCPIDEAAPKGRLILPQQQTIRDILDHGSFPVIAQPETLAKVLDTLKEPPRLIITDSQALSAIKKIVPDEIPLTTFSIIMARYKGFLSTAVAGIAHAKQLKEGDRILMAEGCTHHRQCNDIGTVKIPRLLQSHCNCNLSFESCSGSSFPDDLSGYAMIIHCGGCMITEREVLYRMKCAEAQNVPFTNYGIALAHLTGTLERTLRCFPKEHALLNSL